MDTSKTSKAVMFLYFPVLVLVCSFVIWYFWALDNLIPRKYLKGKSFDLALKYSVVASIPMVLLIIIIFIIDTATNPADQEIIDDSKFLKDTKLVLSNTVEHTLLFIINLTVAVNLEILNNERVALLTLFFGASRIVYFFGFSVGSYLNTPWLRYLGLGLTIGNSYILVWLNLQSVCTLFINKI
jgi:hypothetical protein